MIRVYDADGIERDFSWARVKYNLPLPFEAPRDEDHWEVVELHESIGPSSMTVRVKGTAPLNVPILCGWEDGAITQYTNAEGQTGFGWGPGAFYHPEEKCGPHYVEVAWTSDRVDGLGWIAGTAHAHLEPTFQFVKGEEESEPSDNTREALIALLNALEEAIEKARRALGGE